MYLLGNRKQLTARQSVSPTIHVICYTLHTVCMGYLVHLGINYCFACNPISMEEEFFVLCSNACLATVWVWLVYVFCVLFADRSC